MPLFCSANLKHALARRSDREQLQQRGVLKSAGNTAGAGSSAASASSLSAASAGGVGRTGTGDMSHLLNRANLNKKLARGRPSLVELEAQGIYKPHKGGAAGASQELESNMQVRERGDTARISCCRAGYMYCLPPPSIKLQLCSPPLTPPCAILLSAPCSGASCRSGPTSPSSSSATSTRARARAGPLPRMQCARRCAALLRVASAAHLLHARACSLRHSPAARDYVAAVAQL